MALSNADVAKVAVLARLRLSPAELETFTGQLNSIVDYVAQLQELDTTGVEPLAHGVEVRNVLRDDVRGPALDREAALANAPKRNQEGFLVPAVLE
jgi:aspartyl-tRNA(Asn)/glutamyl-tRNA(Gln) amidotransferase subunit C